MVATFSISRAVCSAHLPSYLRQAGVTIATVHYSTQITLGRILFKDVEEKQKRTAVYLELNS